MTECARVIGEWRHTPTGSDRMGAALGTADADNSP